MENRIAAAIRKKMAETDTPFYLYDQVTIRDRARQLRRDFADCEFLYSIKTNPFLPVVQTLVGEGFGIDAASLREVEIGAALGVEKEQILYSAPGKTDADIAAAMDRSILVADSLGELERIEALAAERGERLEVGVRVNPNFTMDDPDHGVGGKFGIDEEQLLAYDFGRLPHLTLIGLHVHARSQELSASVLRRYYENLFALAERCQERLPLDLRFLNMGGGLGIPYSTANDHELDTAALGLETAAMLAGLRERLGKVRIIIETGRYVAGPAGCYCTRIVDIKESYGKKYLIARSTLNGFLRPPLARLVAASAPPRTVPKGNEPLFTKYDAFDFLLLTDETETETVELCGNLCTGTDIMASALTLPRAKVGDILVVTKAGSYAYVLTPVQFSSQPAPEQFLLTADGRFLDR